MCREFYKNEQSWFTSNDPYGNLKTIYSSLKLKIITGNKNLEENLETNIIND